MRTSILLAMAASALWSPVPSPTRAGLRGLAAPDASTVWIGGTEGTLLLSTDAGGTWTNVAPPDAGGLDFRDVLARDARTAVAMTAGEGDRTRLYRTTDGGSTWTTLFVGRAQEAFLDALAAADERRLYAVGDPIAGRFLFLASDNGGVTWSERPGPLARKGESAFAASGTCLFARGRRIVLVTGGTCARSHTSDDEGKTWTARELPLAHGEGSTGAFSVAFADDAQGVVVGGDYKKPAASDGVAAFTSDGGKTWTASPRPPNGFRSAVAPLPAGRGREWITVGTSGTDRSQDGGRTWEAVDATALNALVIAGDVAWSVGAEGAIRRGSVAAK
jgi:photosystem II stability/assembly factor-like uncharacterized protein